MTDVERSAILNLAVAFWQSDETASHELSTDFAGSEQIRRHRLAEMLAPLGITLEEAMAAVAYAEDELMARLKENMRR